MAISPQRTFLLVCSTGPGVDPAQLREGEASGGRLYGAAAPQSRFVRPALCSCIFCSLLSSTLLLFSSSWSRGRLSGLGCPRHPCGAWFILGAGKHESTRSFSALFPSVSNSFGLALISCSCSIFSASYSSFSCPQESGKPKCDCRENHHGGTGWLEPSRHEAAELCPCPLDRHFPLPGIPSVRSPHFKTRL